MKLLCLVYFIIEYLLFRWLKVQTNWVGSSNLEKWWYFWCDTCPPQFPHQTWNKQVALHHPGNFFYTTISQNWVPEVKNYRTTKKRSCDFLKVKVWYVKLKFIARLKKKGHATFRNQTWVRKVVNHRTTKKKVLQAFIPAKRKFTSYSNLCLAYDSRFFFFYKITFLPI